MFPTSSRVNTYNQNLIKRVLFSIKGKPLMLRTPLISRLPATYNQRQQLRRNNNLNQNTSSCNQILCVSSCGKLLVTVGVLLAEGRLNSSLSIWLMMTAVCDLISTSQNDAGSSSEPSIDVESQEIQSQAGSSSISPKVMNTVQTINNLYYFALWIWGHFIYHQTCIDCSKNSQAVVNLVFLYLYCGYFFVGCSLLMAIFNRDLLGFFTFSLIKLTPKPKKECLNLDNLSIKPYTSDMVGTNECYICLNNYNEGNSIAELPCNSKHHFHEACIKKWLKINNACPLCRKTVDGTTDVSSKSEVELASIRTS